VVVVAEHRRCLEPDRMVIDWFGKFKVQESMGRPRPSNGGVEIQGRVDLAVGTIFCGKRLNELLLAPISQPVLD
jgi:hypothetical protein